MLGGFTFDIQKYHQFALLLRLCDFV